MQKQRVLDGADGDAEPLRVTPQLNEEGVPVAESEPGATRFRPHRSEIEQQVPHSDVDDAVAPGIGQGENRGRRWRTDALERGQRLEPGSLVARRERQARLAPDACGR